MPLFSFYFDKKIGGFNLNKIDYINLHPEKWKSVKGEMFFTEYVLKFKEKKSPEDDLKITATPTSYKLNRNSLNYNI
jgi:hypothetical protein